MQSLETSTWIFCYLARLQPLAFSKRVWERGDKRGSAATRSNKGQNIFSNTSNSSSAQGAGRGRRSSKHFSSSRHRWTTLREPAPESASDRRCTTRWKAPHKEKLAKRISREMDWAKYAFTEMKAVASRLTHWELWCDCDFVKNT